LQNILQLKDYNITQSLDKYGLANSDFYARMASKYAPLLKSQNLVYQNNFKQSIKVKFGVENYSIVFKPVVPPLGWRLGLEYSSKFYDSSE
jgi:hypothetical protein